TIVDGAVCGGNPLWRDFNSFTLTTSYAPPPPPPPDGGCYGSMVTSDVSLQTKTLYQYGCVMGRTTYRRVDMTDREIETLTNLLASLRTECRTMCIADG